MLSALRGWFAQAVGPIGKRGELREDEGNGEWGMDVTRVNCECSKLS